jgi:bifunctional oligoribonuclease and PAP phosphatase NrnA
MPIDWQPMREIIDGHQRFVITSHVRPDADALGSELGLAILLEQLGKEVRIVNPSSTPEHLKWLDPEGVIQKIGGELTVETLCETDVHVIVDTSARGQLQEMCKVLDRTPARKVVIDHHVSSDDLGAVEFKDVSASATGVLITELVEACGVVPTERQATALFSAIATDTGWFRFSNADSRTFLTAARLIDHGVRPSLVYRELYERTSLSRLKLHSLVLARVALDCAGRLAHTWVFRRDFDETGAHPSDTEDLVNSCLTIEGTEAAFILVEQVDGRVKASLRSRNSLNVAAIAEQFGGGGHKAAAGAMLPGPLVNAQQSLLTAFEHQLS